MTLWHHIWCHCLVALCCRYESIIATLCENLDTLDEPEAKASMIWIIGEYAERIDNADELLEQFLETFPEETSLVSLSPPSTSKLAVSSDCANSWLVAHQLLVLPRAGLCAVMFKLALPYCPSLALHIPVVMPCTPTQRIHMLDLAVLCTSCAALHLQGTYTIRRHVRTLVLFLPAGMCYILLDDILPSSQQPCP